MTRSRRNRLAFLLPACLWASGCQTPPRAIAPTNTDVLAELANAHVPMQPFGRVQRTDDALVIAVERNGAEQVSSVDLPKASRVFGVIANLPQQTAREMRVWLWRGPIPSPPTDWIDITGEVTPLGARRGYRIAFRDISAEPALRAWSQGDATVRAATLAVHPHDNGFAVGFVAPAAMGAPYSLGAGVPGSTVYAIRLGR